MAIQVINRGVGLGGRLGQALGGGLGQGFSTGLEDARKARGLASILGISEEEALPYANLDPQIVKEAIKAKRLKSESESFNKALSGFEESLYGQPTGANLFAQEQTQQKSPNLQQMLELISESKLQDLYGQPTAQTQPKEPLAEQTLAADIFEQPKTKVQDNRSKVQKFRDYLRTNKILLSPEQRREAEKQLLEEDKLTQEMKKESRSESRKFRERIDDEYEQAQEQLLNLQRLKELNTEGKLDSNAYNAFLEGLGIDISALRSNDAQEFNKTALNFLKTGRSIFGGRLTDNDVNQILQMIPNLDQSPKGRARIIASLEQLQKAKKARFDAFYDILEENKGILPDDYRRQLEKRIEPKIQKYYKQFKNEIAAMEKLLPESSQASDIIGANIAGRALKGVGRAAEIAAPTALGAYLGSPLGPLGTAGGAGLGALLGFLNSGGAQAARSSLASSPRVPRFVPDFDE